MVNCNNLVKNNNNHMVELVASQFCGEQGLPHGVRTDGQTNVQCSSSRYKSINRFLIWFDGRKDLGLERGRVRNWSKNTNLDPIKIELFLYLYICNQIHYKVFYRFKYGSRAIPCATRSETLKLIIQKHVYVFHCCITSIYYIFPTFFFFEKRPILF